MAIWVYDWNNGTPLDEDQLVLSWTTYPECGGTHPGDVTAEKEDPTTGKALGARFVWDGALPPVSPAEIADRWQRLPDVCRDRKGVSDV